MYKWSASVVYWRTYRDVGHAGGFADKVRAGWQWVIPLPDDLDPTVQDHCSVAALPYLIRF
jgi:D-arabinose 1-dehydrogenase-like Zn-dependent alcohol dehydrogenase